MLLFVFLQYEIGGGCTRRYQGLNHQAIKVLTTVKCNTYTHLHETVFKTGQQIQCLSQYCRNKKYESKIERCFQI